MSKILILTYEIPNNFHAGSMQLLRVLKGYPAANLCVIGPSPPNGVEILPCNYLSLPYPIQRLRNTRFHKVALSAALCFNWLRPSVSLIKKLLGSFKPDVVFTVMDNTSYYLMAHNYAKQMDLPLITMTMDEPNSFEKHFWFLAGVRERSIAEVYQYSKINMCVSRQMTAHIADTYRCSTETFYFGPPEGLTPRAAEVSRETIESNCLTLGYAGGLSYGYKEAIQAISQAVLDLPVKINIYSRNSPDWALASNTEYVGCFPPSELWERVKSECDASLLIYDFSEEMERLYRTHFPTKLSEYTWLGMPMVMVGPSVATGIIWGCDHPACAVVESDSSLRSLPSKLSELHTSADKRVSMAQAAAAEAQAQFDPVRIREAFQEKVGDSSLF